ncbi:MAG: glycosyltransferase family 4 protein [Candidatus Aminicenantes bacterium]|nr:glycosyltransferase family 4 protein [Candidatus Aminicenantes bacterium]
MKPLRVLEMIDKPFLGGGQKVVLSLAKGLDRERFAVSVCSRDEGPLAEAVRELGLPFLPAPFSKRPSRRLVEDLRRLLIENDVGLLHTHGGVAGLYGRWAARRAGTPAVVHTLHGIHYLHYRNPLLRRFYIGLERRCSRYTDAVICVSEADRNRAVKLRLSEEGRLKLIRNGVEPPPEASPERERALSELRARVKLDPPVVGTVARLHRQKGVAYLLKAAERLVKSRPGVKVVVVGGGPLERKFRRALERGGLGRTVVLLGERADAADLMELFDVFVLPSLWEGLPLVLAEAAARGKPVVAADIDGVREVIRNGETGLLVPPKDPEALAAAVDRLLGDPALAGGLAARAQAEIPPRFTLDRMAAGHAALYLKLTR